MNKSACQDAALRDCSTQQRELKETARRCAARAAAIPMNLASHARFESARGCASSSSDHPQAIRALPSYTHRVEFFRVELGQVGRDQYRRLQTRIALGPVVNGRLVNLIASHSTYLRSLGAKPQLLPQEGARQVNRYSQW